MPESPVDLDFVSDGAASTFTITVLAGHQYVEIETNGNDAGLDAFQFTCPILTCTITITQSSKSACEDNGTPMDVLDDYFTLTVNASVVLGEPNYEVVLGADADGTGGTVLATAPFGNAVTLGDGINGVLVFFQQMLVLLI